MSDPKLIVEKLLFALIDVQNNPSKDLTKGDPFRFPRLIPFGNGTSFQITKEIDDLILALAAELKQSHHSLNRSTKDEEWRQWVRNLIGPTVMSMPEVIDKAGEAAEFLSLLQQSLSSIVGGLAIREYSFGTTLFSNADILPFSIGPATFESRQLWLDRRFAEGLVSSTSKARIEKCWAGKAVRPLRNKLNQLRERDLIEGIGACPYVCTVKLKSPFASEAGLETALITARLALALVAITYEASAQALLGFNLLYDGPLHLQKALAFIPGKVILNGSKFSKRISGPHISPSDWTNELSSRSDMFSGGAEVLKDFVDPANPTSRKLLLGALLQSLIWFERGCREAGDLTAIVFFAASMDALGKGMKAKGILKVLEMRAGIMPTNVLNNGNTIAAQIDAIYSDARSRTIHGTSDKIGTDWSGTRPVAEWIARIALYSCLDFAAKSPSATSADDLKK